MLITANQNVEYYDNIEVNDYEDISSPLLELIIEDNANRTTNAYEDILPLLLESLDAIRNGELSAKEVGEFLARETDIYSVFNGTKQPIVIEDISLYVILGNQRGFVKAQTSSGKEVLKATIPLQDIYSMPSNNSKDLIERDFDTVNKRYILKINLFTSIFAVASFVVVDIAIVNVSGFVFDNLDYKYIFLFMVALSSIINFFVVVVVLSFVNWITSLQSSK